MKKTLQIANVLAFIVTLYFNYASSVGVFNDRTQAEMSATYHTLFTPAGYAFSIWGLIYLLLFGFVTYQSRSLFVSVRDDSFVMRTGWWFVLSCAANSLWCYLFVSDMVLASVVVIFFLLFCVLKIVLNNAMELWDAPISVIVCLWWPFVSYSGWLTVACIANVATYLVKIQWDGLGLAPELYAVFIIGIAIAINLIVTWTRNMREFALVGAWALAGIAVANQSLENMVQSVAVVGAVILVVNSSIHAFRNRNTNPG